MEPGRAPSAYGKLCNHAGVSRAAGGSVQNAGERRIDWLLPADSDTPVYEYYSLSHDRAEVGDSSRTECPGDNDHGDGKWESACADSQREVDGADDKRDGRCGEGWGVNRGANAPSFTLC